MFSILGALLFTIIIVFSMLVLLGLPFGDFTMGGQNKILPIKYRIISIIFIVIQIFAIIIILQSGGYFPLWFSLKATKGICTFFSVYLTINIFMNIFSKSRKEKFVMTPLAFFAAICFWVTTFRM